MKAQLKTQTSTGLVLTPQLQQSIRLLALSGLELEQEVAQMLLDNPFLEAEFEPAMDSELASQHERQAAEQQTAQDEAETRAADDLPESEAEASWEGDGLHPPEEASSEWGDEAPAITAQLECSSMAASDEDFDRLSLQSLPETLQSHLQQQALGLRLAPEVRAALHFLIESLNEDGYLEDSLASLAHGLAQGDDDALDTVFSALQQGLKQLHKLDPTGVGARDLAECLKLQIQTWPAGPVQEVALEIASHHLKTLAKRHAGSLARACRKSVALVETAMAAIMQLEPKPGRRFVATDHHIIVPDIIVSAKGQGRQRLFTAQLNPAVVPRLAVNEGYAGLLRRSGNEAMQQSLHEARGFIRHVRQRFDTLLRTAEMIVQEQQEFFLTGPTGMRPMVLRELADRLGLHESTISRVTTQKYMATPQGTFELKYFFSSGLASQGDEGNASSTAVRAYIKQLVDAEDKAKPLSDNQIAERLQQQLGIECARRTVAKYRDMLRIPTVSQRRQR